MNTTCVDTKECGETCPVTGHACKQAGNHLCCAIGLQCFDYDRFVWQSNKGICYDHFPRQADEICGEPYHCADGLTCDESNRTCRPKQFGDKCGRNNGGSSRPKDWGTCGLGLSCTDGKCYHDPRLENEPCWNEDHLRCMDHLVCRSGACMSTWETAPTWEAWAATAAMACLILVAIPLCFFRRGRGYALLEMDLANQSAGDGNRLLRTAEEKARQPPSMDEFPYSYQEWTETMQRFGHFMAPSQVLLEEERRSFQSPCPYDIFLVHTGTDLNSYADPMFQIFQSNGFRCFMDKRNIEATNGPPTQQMRDALESCRYVIVLISKRFLERQDPCSELEYAFDRMLWIREHKGWESLRVVLLDLSVAEYRQKRQDTRPSLPDLGTEIAMFNWRSGDGGFALWSDLCHAVKADVFSHDLRGSEERGKAVEKWRDLLRNWENEEAMREFPRSSELYPAEIVFPV